MSRQLQLHVVCIYCVHDQNRLGDIWESPVTTMKMWWQLGESGGVLGGGSLVAGVVDVPSVPEPSASPVRPEAFLIKVRIQWPRWNQGVSHGHGWIPKEENSIGVVYFRPISLLSVKGKIFVGVITRPITKSLLQNKHINKPVKKEDIPGFPSCLEHA